ncbi:hypothetical protein SSP24_62660 [Streptomyces spinoverrucosus]|uniref:TerD domain-containing protein n=1 Tax=Streptomyces spinoverrucosus TaxID=284043 RepID=A0A4Y3VS43_9ACTN|nr:hypothetical protein SSP24_62660 [Streptomyces spinoverrucosus]GHB68836.1 hypothetical protein GCM10010397_43950 [Streptomyces spinoverrucosus]
MPPDEPHQATATCMAAPPFRIFYRHVDCLSGPVQRARTAHAKEEFAVGVSLCDASGKVLSDRHFVFHNNLTSPDGSVEHTGDNLTGEGEGDDEVVKVNLAAVPAEVDGIVFPVSIHDAEGRGQSFGQVRSSASCTGEAPSGSSARSGRAMPPDWPGSPPTSASTSDLAPTAPSGPPLGDGPDGRLPHATARRCRCAPPSVPASQESEIT